MKSFNQDEIREIKQQSLAGAICAQLEEMILSGKIKPGERINESRLSSMLGVSRAPIREACRQLERSGMVEVKVRRGTFVRTIDVQDIEELYEIRAVLDALGGARAAERIDEAGLDELGRHVRDMEKAAEAGKVPDFYRSNLAFHMSIIRISGNRSLLPIYESISKKAALFRQTSLSLPGRLHVSLGDHREILNALRAGDVERTAGLMRTHIEEAKKALLESLREPQASETQEQASTGGKTC